jgi:wyosine [tRNA(Phe)-imidazoG37] synthetase (radical SAM superfamily)
MKTCNWNCVYCQLGRSVPVVNEREDYVPPDDIIAEVRNALKRHGEDGIDWVTFVGSGEPLLHKSIGRILRDVKAMTQIPVALLTNGSFLHLPDVRNEVSVVDAVMPTIDAGSAEMFKRVNRPHPGIAFDAYIDGLVAFGREYEGELWPEVMLVKGVNDTEDALKDIANILQRIGPDEVHVSLPTRPPAETTVEPPDDEGLLRAVAILGETARVVRPTEAEIDLSGFDNVVEAIIAVVSRHPMRVDEIEDALAHWAPDEIQTALAELQESGNVRIVERHGVSFWASAESFYPEDKKDAS